MTSVLDKITTATSPTNNFTVTTEELICLLTRYRLIQRLSFELIIDRAIAFLTCTSSEVAETYQKFYQKHRIISQAKLKAWLKNNDMTLEQLENMLVRELKIEKLKQTLGERHLKSYFLKRRPQLDKVMYSLIQVKDLEIAQELYFRIQEEEYSFAELAKEYSQGAAAANGGLTGPIELSSCHPKLAKMMYAGKSGQLWQPVRIDEWVSIVQLEKLIPAQLDELTKQRLLSEIFADWLTEQFQKTELVLSK